MVNSLLLALIFAMPLQAATVWLDELVQAALERNPEIHAVQRRWEAAQARPIQERTLPNPTMSVYYQDSGGIIPGTSIGQDMVSFIGPMFMQDIPFPSKLRLRGEVAQTEADATGRIYTAVQLHVANEVKQAYFDLYATERSIETIRRSRDLLQQFLDVARTRYSVGEALQQDVLKASVELALLDDRLIPHEERQEALRARINQLLHQSPDEPFPPTHELRVTPLSYELEQLYAAAQEANPVLDSRRLMIDRAARRTELAGKEYLPNFNVKVGHMFMGRLGNAWDVSIGAEVPLFFWRKERRGVEEAAAELRETRSEFESAAQDLLREVKEHYLAGRSASRLASLYRDTVIPQAELTLESSLSSYRVGRLDSLTILSNWALLLDFEMEYYDKVAEHEKALGNLERLTGLRLLEYGGSR